MTSPIRAVLFGVAALCLGAAAPARAEEVDAATQGRLRQVITDQLDAFAHDDADRAESFAAPGIREKFPDAQSFVAMVRHAYAPLVQPRSTEFDKAGSSAGNVIQAVTIVDRDGAAWKALYSFEQVDGQWRINGCVLVKDDSTGV